MVFLRRTSRRRPSSCVHFSAPGRLTPEARGTRVGREDVSPAETTRGSARSARSRERKRRPPPPAAERAHGGTVVPIVGIGASAGGLEAFKQLFRGMPGDSGMAFVLIQHLDPTRKSLTAELVGTYTPMPVVQASDGMRVEANRVYVIPPNKYLSIRERTLRLSAPTEPRSLRMAVDFFLR